jgi:hypothetical protein
MPPAAALWLFVNDYKTVSATAISLWGIYVLYRLVTIPTRWRARRARRAAADKANELLEAMLKAWSASRGSTINPSRLKELVVAAEERGAMFPAVLHTIIDRAMNRDPTALVRARTR